MSQKSLMPSLPEGATLLELLGCYPELARRMVAANGYVMRGPSPLTEAEREMLAAYISALNSCDYCVGSHSEAAKAFGVSEETLKALIENAESADIDDRLKPIVAFVRKLTLSPARITLADAEAVYAAGWDEDALLSAILVCCTFNFMNRLVDGTGLVSSEKQAVMSGRMLHSKGYEGVLEALGLMSKS